VTTAIAIRAARPRDVEQIARIWDEGWRDAHLGNVPEALVRARTPASYPPRVRDRLTGTIVAHRGSDVQGFVVVVGDEVEQVYVASTARGTGVAAALIEDAERRIAEAGHLRAWLAVVANNARARAFYERQGWRDAGEFLYPAEVELGVVYVLCRRYEKDLSGAR
jgi:GNAT superfamily N-acetyltransferase